MTENHPPARWHKHSGKHSCPRALGCWRFHLSRIKIATSFPPPKRLCALEQPHTRRPLHLTLSHSTAQFSILNPSCIFTQTRLLCDLIAVSTTSYPHIPPQHH